MKNITDDCISRQAAIDELKRISFSHWFECGEYLLEDTREIEIISSSKALEAIEALPPVQPEIIHCRDCRYYIPYDWMFDDLTRSSNINDYSQDEIGCAVNDHNYPPDGYCSNAERRTDDGE